MSYAKNLEDKIRQEGYDDLPRRVAILKDQLDRPAALNRRDAVRELRYLERAVLSGRSQFPEIAEQVKALRTRFDMLPPLKSAIEPDFDRFNSSSAQSSGAGSRSGVNALASFLCPDELASDGQDEVRLMSFEGRLACELGRYPVLAVPETSSALVLRSWAPEDDEECAEKERASQRLALLELTQSAANLREMQELVSAHLLRQGEAIEQVAQNVSSTRTDVEEGVAALEDIAETSRMTQMLAWLGPSLGVILLGAALTSPACGAACVAAKTATGTGIFAAGGARGLSLGQQRALARMKEQIPTAIQAVPQAQVAALCAKGDEAEKGLLTKLDDTATWQAFPFSLKGRRIGLVVRQRSSETRRGGQAFATTFTTDLPARRVFQTVQRLSMAGELENGCNFVWSRPVDESRGVYMRYLAFSESYAKRDFFCVCRQGRVKTSISDGEREHYVYVLASLDSDVLTMDGSALPQPDTSRHGSIHICGFSIKDRDGGGAVVDVMADVDQATLLPTVLADRDVRLHALRTAERVMNELRSEKQ